MEHLVLVGHQEFPDLSVELEIVSRVGARVERASVTDSSAGWERADAVMVSTQRLDARFIAGLSRCRIIARVGTGVDAIDIDAAARCGIWVANVPDAYTEDVSAHAMALLLALARRLPSLARSTRAGSWDSGFVRPLHSIRGSTLGIIGFGRIGRAMAAKARAFDMDVLFHDPLVSRDAGAAAGARSADLDALLPASDYVSLHIPLTDGTRGLIGAAALARMKPGACLINTSRGALVDETALIAALRSGALAGAGLDVLAAEPPSPENPLLALENVLVTPHIGWYSEESTRFVRVKSSEEVARVLGGSAPLNPVNRLQGKEPVDHMR